MSKNVISHDQYGSKVYSDSIVYDGVANEYFIPVKRGNQYGDEFMHEFYPLEPKHISVLKKHATVDDLKTLMQKSSSDTSALFNVSGDFDAKK